MSEMTFEREVLDRLTKSEVKLDSFDAAKEKTYDNENDIIRLKDDAKNQGSRIHSLRILISGWRGHVGKGKHEKQNKEKAQDKRSCPT